MAVDTQTYADAPLVMGRIGGPYGVKGWLHVVEYTDKPGNLLDYSCWHLKQKGAWREVKRRDGRQHGKGLIIKLPDCDNREDAALLKGAEIGIYREQLPAVEEHEYYWNDLIGMQVITTNEERLGPVDHLIETGANDVLVIKGEREILIPYIRKQVIESVDLEAREIRVNWDPDY